MLHRTARSALHSLALVTTAGVLAACAAEPNDPSTSAEVNPSRVEAITCSMPRCGTALQTFDGTTAFSNGPNTSTGISCNGEGGRYGYEYQCVELVMRHFTTHWGLSWHGNAKDLLNNAPRASVDVYRNGDAAHPPVRGDMVVWTNGAYGHVALVTAVTATSVEIIEQNVCGSGHAVLSYSGGRIGSRWGSWVPAGWAHARANIGTGTPSPTPSPSPTPTPAPDCSTSASGTSSVWTCTSDRAARQRCVSGAVQTEPCASGCVRQPSGIDDYCASAPAPAPTCHAAAEACTSNADCCSGLTCNSGTCGSAPAPVSWDCSRSAYNGSQYWTCSGSARFRCVDGVPQREACASGCVSQPVGTNDYCAGSTGGGTVTWNCANSAYNGSQYWTCSGGNLYRCSGGVPQIDRCAAGCAVHPVGTNDTCN